MGRELKRVPLDFDWELHKTWDGYLNPYCSTICEHCEGSGYNSATLEIHNSWYSFHDREWEWTDEQQTRRYNKKAWCNNLEQADVDALVRTGRLMDFTHTWTPERGWVKKDPPYVPTAEEVNKWDIHSLGHDAINRGICVKVKALRLGVWGVCDYCNGDGELFGSAEDKHKCETWEPTEPPAGDGYQLWETTSEGSPISPVFETPDKLCEYAEKNCSVFGGTHTTAEDWKQMLNDGFVCAKVGNMVFI
jgi:hypothetical protein